VLGVPVDELDLGDTVLAIARLAASSGAEVSASYVCVRDVNGIVECQHDPGLRLIHERAALVTPDGMPVVWWGRLSGHGATKRVYGPDLMLEVCGCSAEFGLRHFLCGGEPGVAERLADALRARCPGLAVVGSWTPPFRPLRADERADLIRRIKDSGANIIWLGLSSPKQERFMADLAPDLDGGVLIGVGAAFDFLSGRKPQAPLWIRHSGFEWLFRLATEPRRLWRRYLVNNSHFIWLAGRALLHHLRSDRPTADDVGSGHRGGCR
jgi:N-acetylglucosaminyldiphosphoundecaprenol N-acetyl-beta-D-mannosaminyltransferase